jgi:hypothetical protein
MLKSFLAASNGVGKYVTLGSALLLPFFLMAAANPVMIAAAAKGATAGVTGAGMGVSAAAGTSVVTNGAISTSFWSGLWTHPVTGEAGIGIFFNKMGTGACALTASVTEIGSAGLHAAAGGESVWGALKAAWGAPAATIAA